MALTFGDNIHTKTFTPQEYLVEILSSAKNKNVIISLEGTTNKIFVILKLIRELAFKIHRLVIKIKNLINNDQMINEIIFYRKSEKRKWTLLVLEETEIDQYMFSIRHLTDLKPLDIRSVNHLDFINYEVCIKYCTFLSHKKNILNILILVFQVIVTTENLCLELFEKKYLHFDQLNLAIFNNCQKIIEENSTYFKVFYFFFLIRLIILNKVKAL